MPKTLNVYVKLKDVCIQSILSVLLAIISNMIKQQWCYTIAFYILGSWFGFREAVS